MNEEIVFLTLDSLQEQTLRALLRQGYLTGAAVFCEAHRDYRQLGAVRLDFRLIDGKRATKIRKITSDL